MTTALTFNDVTFSPVTHQNSLWIRSAELARALGYKDDSSVRKIYERNADEFTPEMTQVVEIFDTVNLTVSENLKNKVRIFSLRGCHLLAMFARTPVAKQFRRWVLDVLDSLNAERTTPAALPASDAAITPDQQCTLQAMVKTLVERGGIYANIWSRFNNHFRIARYSQLPQSRMSEAVDYLMRLEVTPKALQPAGRESLTAAPDTLPDDMPAGYKNALKRIQSIMDAMDAARQVVRIFCYPAPRSMNTPRIGRLTYDARHDFYAAAMDCLVAARAALEECARLSR